MPAHTGGLPPADVNTCPAVPAAVNANAVPVPYAEPPAVAVAVELVPPFAIGSVPDISAVKLTAPKLGAPDALPCSTVVVVPAAVDAIAVVVEPYTTPYCVNVLACPVPPLATAKVPATVTAPVVVVAGVSPVLPNVIELTPEPAPENCAQVMAVTLIVPPALLVQTQPVSASVVPVSIKT